MSPGRTLVGLTACLALAAGGCGPASDKGATEPWFRDSAAAAGLEHAALSGHDGTYLLPEIVFGGAALVDIDGDGDLDAYLVQGGRVGGRPDASPAGNRLFENDGNGRFRDITEASGAGDTGYGMGVAAGDFDNDGNVDLYVTNVGPNVLLRGHGDGTFSDVSAASGTADPGFGSSAAFVDYDADGDLDLFVVNYVNWTPANELTCYNNLGARDYCLPTNYNAPAADVLLQNQGDGTFVDVSREAGLHAAFGNGLGIATADFDGDGRVDIFVANDTTLNQLWMNRGDGTFVDEALLRGCALDQHGSAKAGMGVAIGDLDDDLDQDLLVVNLQNQSDSYFRNDDGLFSDRGAQLGVAAASRPFTRFGAGFADFDNDSILDLFEAGGAVQRLGEPLADDPYAQPNLLFQGTTTGRFREVLPRGGVAETTAKNSRAAVFGDVDNDGGIDVLVVNRDGPVELLRNVVPNRGRWLLLRVVDEHGRDALGASVTAKIGERVVRRDVRSAYSYCAANDPRVHLGLGDADGASEVRVRWVDGSTTDFGRIEADQVRVLTRPAPF